MFMGRGGVRWNFCVSARLGHKHVIEVAGGCFCRGGVFLNRRSVGAVQCAFRRHFDISPRNRIPPDRKCVFMWMDAFRATEKVSKEREGPSKTVRIPEIVERVRLSIQTGI
ncbi:hypothetical protein TNCV_740971 [Trichonephila clavipes]|nr:hypothetical protein TNCV_740971 [Trichonephila clavipes]